jgi:hypothetical protein
MKSQYYLSFVHGFTAANFFNPEPMLKIARLNNNQHSQFATCAFGPMGGKIQGAPAFWRIVQNDKKFPAMTGFGAFTDSTHGRMLPFPGKSGKSRLTAFSNFKPIPVGSVV